MSREIEYLMKLDIAYEEGKSLLNDIDYDKLKVDVKKKYPNDSYFKTVGSKLNNSISTRSMTLPYIMGSLDKVNVDTVKEWVKNKGYVTASEKIDGVSLMCKWVNKEPTLLVLRGNGEVGQDITDKASYFVPQINTDAKTVLRGEATLIDEDYKKLNYANRRNGAAGILNKEEADDTLKLLHVYFYEVIEAEFIPKEEYERFTYIKSLGLNTPDFSLITTKDFPRIVDMLIEFLKQSKKYKPYDVDGIVLAKNVSERENVLFPENKIAFKIKNDEVTVTVKNVTWQTSRLGKLKPVINIRPVNIGGVTISNVTGFNSTFIIDNNIGIDTKLSLIRSGDVIPHITGVVKSTNYKLPKKCPSCGGKIKFDGEEIICGSIYCSGSEIKKAAYSLKTIGVKGYSEKWLQRLKIENLKDIVDFDKINVRVRTYSMYYRYVNAVRRALRSIEAYKILASFGIQGIGLKVAKEICDELHIDSNAKFENEFFIKDNINVDIGEITLKSLNDNIHKYKSFFSELLSKGYLNITPTQLRPVSGKLEGMTFVITGTLPIRRSRVIEIIEDNGGKVAGSVSSKVNMLITSGLNTNSTKYKKAEQLGISIHMWSEFKEIYKI